MLRHFPKSTSFIIHFVQYNVLFIVTFFKTSNFTFLYLLVKVVRRTIYEYYYFPIHLQLFLKNCNSSTLNYNTSVHLLAGNRYINPVLFARSGISGDRKRRVRPDIEYWSHTLNPDVSWVVTGPQGCLAIIQLCVEKQ